MKKLLFAASLSFLLIGSYAQSPFAVKMQEPDLHISVENTAIAKITRLDKANLMKDIIDSYPSSWIYEYISTEMKGTSGGTGITARGSNDTLSTEQKNLIKKLDLGTDLVIEIKYKAKNAVNGKTENSTLKLTMTVLSDVKAEFPGGKEQMTKFLKDNFLDKISEKDKETGLGNLTVAFTVNENGEIVNPYVKTPAKTESLNKKALEAVSAMPRFKPAEISDGTRVKQEFRFSYSGSRGGC